MNRDKKGKFTNNHENHEEGNHNFSKFWFFLANAIFTLIMLLLLHYFSSPLKDVLSKKIIESFCTCDPCDNSHVSSGGTLNFSPFK